MPGNSSAPGSGRSRAESRPARRSSEQDRRQSSPLRRNPGDPPGRPPRTASAAAGVPRLVPVLVGGDDAQQQIGPPRRGRPPPSGRRPARIACRDLSGLAATSAARPARVVDRLGILRQRQRRFRAFDLGQLRPFLRQCRNRRLAPRRSGSPRPAPAPGPTARRGDPAPSRRSARTRTAPGRCRHPPAIARPLPPAVSISASGARCLALHRQLAGGSGRASPSAAIRCGALVRVGDQPAPATSHRRSGWLS